MKVAVTVALYAVTNATGLLALSHVLRSDTPRSVGTLLTAALGQPITYVGGSLYVIGFLCWLYLLSLDAVSLVYPVAVGCAYAITVAGAGMFLGETFNAAKIGGVILVIAGISLLVVGRTQS
jgi:drug/metabolite transporter (DMT)-like permease